MRLLKGKEEDTVFPVNGFPVDTNSAASLLLPRDRLTHETSPYRFYAKWNGLHRCLSSCRPKRSNAATRSQPLCFAQHTLLPSIYLSPSFAPLGPSWSREKVQTPGSVPTRTPDRFPNKAFWVPRPSGSPSVALLWGAKSRRVSMDVLCSRLSLNCYLNIGKLMRMISG
ncbi:uncharacterized protein BO87DRAFT_7794 [Aspergillus neoniger CBS 115656]|uniref:Uncharacterized protein n=1 Tax=Aspergillus neoniger (strain CBS 115656) TaxID=1448310 RepID=A0A318ZHY4_ASPNB|nr:hypothetical protein BO87DRAFT_7794 [Aspergillus neoniger CBS 115656]PYH39848.1 hypothetical protein BO87DRAFT_7794 [Aspergillus neoniger CBS 115656]